jgi:hypothetical protein
VIRIVARIPYVGLRGRLVKIDLRLAMKWQWTRFFAGPAPHVQ